MAVETSSSSQVPALIPKGKLTGKSAIPLARPVILAGSRDVCRLHLVSHTVSKVHTLIVNEDAGTYVHDLASRTHTIVNGKAVPEAVLNNGDKLQIGSFEFQFKGNRSAGAKSASTPMGQLEGKNLSEPHVILHRVIMIGRRPGCDVILPGDAVSQTHAVIYERNGDRYVRDLGSRTGTLLNGKKIHDEKITFGDTLRIGNASLKYAKAENFVPDELDDLIGTAPLVQEDIDVSAPIAEVALPRGTNVPLPIDEPEALPEGKIAPEIEPEPVAEVEPELPEPAPIESAPFAPPEVQGTINEIPVEPEIDLSEDPDIVGGPADTQQLPAIEPNDPPKPVLSPQVIDLAGTHTPASDETTEAIEEAPAEEVNSVDALDREIEAALAEAPQEEPSIEQPKSRRGWRSASVVATPEPAIDETPAELDLAKLSRATESESTIEPEVEPEIDLDDDRAAEPEIELASETPIEEARLPEPEMELAPEPELELSPKVENEIPLADQSPEPIALEPEVESPQAEVTETEPELSVEESRVSEPAIELAPEIDTLDAEPELPAIKSVEPARASDSFAGIDLAGEPKPVDEDAALDFLSDEAPTTDDSKHAEVIESTDPTPESAQVLDDLIEPSSETVTVDALTDSAFARDVETLSGSTTGLPVEAEIDTTDLDATHNVDEPAIDETPSTPVLSPLQAIASQFETKKPAPVIEPKVEPVAEELEEPSIDDQLTVPPTDLATEETPDSLVSAESEEEAVSEEPATDELTANELVAEESPTEIPLADSAVETETAAHAEPAPIEFDTSDLDELEPFVVEESVEPLKLETPPDDALHPLAESEPDVLAFEPPEDAAHKAAITDRAPSEEESIEEPNLALDDLESAEPTNDDTAVVAAVTDGTPDETTVEPKIEEPNLAEGDVEDTLTSADTALGEPLEEEVEPVAEAEVPEIAEDEAEIESVTADDLAEDTADNITTEATVEPISFQAPAVAKGDESFVHTESIATLESESPEAVAEAPLQFDLSDLPVEETVATVDVGTVLPESAADISPAVDEPEVIAEGFSTDDPSEQGEFVENATQEIVSPAPAEPETIESPAPVSAAKVSDEISSPVMMPPVAGVFELPSSAAPKVELHEESPTIAPPPPAAAQTQAKSAAQNLFDELFGDVPETQSFLGGMPLALPDVPSNFGRVNIGFDAKPIPAPNSAKPNRSFDIPGASVVVPPARPNVPSQPTVAAKNVVSADTVEDEVDDRPNYHPAEEKLREPSAAPSSSKVVPPSPSRRSALIPSRPPVEIPPEDQLPDFGATTREQAKVNREDHQSNFDGLAMTPPPVKPTIPPRPVFSAKRVADPKAPGKKKKKKDPNRVPANASRDPFTLAQGGASEVPPAELTKNEKQSNDPDSPQLPTPPRPDSIGDRRPPMAARAELTGPAPRKGASLVTIGVAMLVCMGAVVAAIYTLVPVKTEIQARLAYRNLEASSSAERNTFQMKQRELLESAPVREEAKTILITSAGQAGLTVKPGFLADPVAFELVTRGPNNDNLTWSREKPGVMSIKYPSTDPRGDKLRFDALVRATYNANRPLAEALRSKKLELDALVADHAQAKQDLEKLRQSIEAGREKGDNRVAQNQVAQLEKERDALLKMMKDTRAAKQDLLAEIERLKQPIAEPSEEAAKNDPDVVAVVKEKELADAGVVSAKQALVDSQSKLADATQAWTALEQATTDNPDTAPFRESLAKLPRLDKAGRIEEMKTLEAGYNARLDDQLNKTKAADTELKKLNTAKDAAERAYKAALPSGNQQKIDQAKAEFENALAAVAAREKTLADGQTEQRLWPARVATAVSALDEAKLAESTASTTVKKSEAVAAELVTRIADVTKQVVARMAQQGRQRDVDRLKLLESRSAEAATLDANEKSLDTQLDTKERELRQARLAQEDERKFSDKFQADIQRKDALEATLKAKSDALEKAQTEFAKLVEPIEPTAESVTEGKQEDLRTLYSLIAVLSIAAISMTIMFASHRSHRPAPIPVAPKQQRDADDDTETVTT